MKTIHFFGSLNNCLIKNVMELYRRIRKNKIGLSGKNVVFLDNSYAKYQ